MNVTYGITEERYYIGSDSRIAYGIAAYANADADGTGTVFRAVHDITSDRASLEKIVLDCSRLKLSPDHLRDAVDDFLAG